METSVKGMLEVAGSFYRALFSDRGPSGTAYGGVLDALEGSLEDEDRTALKGPLQEVSTAISSLKNVTVLPWIGSELVAVYQECFRKGEMVETMRTGLVSLLYKKGKKEELWGLEANNIVNHGLQSIGKSFDRDLRKS